MVRPDPPEAVLILASASPRRRAFLEGVGLAVALRPVDLAEVPQPGEAPLAFCQRMAREKALGGHEVGPAGPAWSLGSDTVVTLDGHILGKPGGPAEAKTMLRMLAGRTHQVITAWALATRAGRVEAGHTVTEVSFRALDDAQLDAYVATGDPMDKAGAYGIQSGAGAFVTHVAGSYDGVVGLPVAEVCAHLAQLGVVQFPFGLAPRLALVRSAVAGAAVGAGRSPAAVTLVGVSKGQSAPKLAEALRLGLTTLGENYVQEWEGKRLALRAGPQWHFIGHLQRNKAPLVAQHAARVHAVDSVRLAEALGRAAAEAGRVLPVLVQVDLAGEATKSGVSPADLPQILNEIKEIPGLALDGLMAIPPPEPPAEARLRFAALRRLRDACATPALPLPELSMGMSGDFREAIAEGATLVRVGTAIFGERG